MKKLQEMNKENGITLVALVITIIILLILATISIQALTQTGLFKKTQEAKERTEMAEKNQIQMLNEYEEELNKYVKIKVEEIELDKSSITLNVGEEEKIIATIKPDNTTCKNIIWKSNNEDVVNVIDGKITAISEGTAVIIATAEDESAKSASCTVTVEKNMQYLYNQGNQFTQITGGYNTFCRYSVAGAALR